MSQCYIDVSAEMLVELCKTKRPYAVEVVANALPEDAKLVGVSDPEPYQGIVRLLIESEAWLPIAAIGTPPVPDPQFRIREAPPDDAALADVVRAVEAMHPDRAMLLCALVFRWREAERFAAELERVIEYVRDAQRDLEGPNSSRAEENIEKAIQIWNTFKGGPRP